jgi:hypothetical protein
MLDKSQLTKVATGDLERPPWTKGRPNPKIKEEPCHLCRTSSEDDLPVLCRLRAKLLSTYVPDKHQTPLTFFGGVCYLGAAHGALVSESFGRSRLNTFVWGVPPGSNLKRGDPEISLEGADKFSERAVGLDASLVSLAAEISPHHAHTPTHLYHRIHTPTYAAFMQGHVYALSLELPFFQDPAGTLFGPQEWVAGLSGRRERIPKEGCHHELSNQGTARGLLAAHCNVDLSTTRARFLASSPLLS